MKLYLSASYPRRHEMRRVAVILRELGHEVTSTWIEAQYDSGQEAFAAQVDWLDLLRADALVAFTGDLMSEGGRHVEFGLALAEGKAIYLVGPRENVFHHLVEVVQFLTFADFRDYLAARSAEVAP